MGTFERFTVEEKREAGGLYFQYRSYAEVASRMSQSGEREVSKQIINHWDKNGDEHFHAGMDQMSRDVDKRLSGKFLSVEEKALDEMLERLNEKGKVAYRDLVNTISILHDRRQVMEGKATTITATSKSVESKLKDMEKRMAEMVPTSNVTRFPSKETA